MKAAQQKTAIFSKIAKSMVDEKESRRQEEASISFGTIAKGAAVILAAGFIASFGIAAWKAFHAAIPKDAINPAARITAAPFAMVPKEIEASSCLLLSFSSTMLFAIFENMAVFCCAAFIRPLSCAPTFFFLQAS